jgi:hypothetical protein
MLGALVLMHGFSGANLAALGVIVVVIISTTSLTLGTTLKLFQLTLQTLGVTLTGTRLKATAISRLWRYGCFVSMFWFI